MRELKLDIEEYDVGGLTALAHVYQEQNYEQIALLVQLGANLDRPMLENGRTLLMDAAMRGNSSMFGFLLGLGASRDKKCHTGRTVAEYAKLNFEGKSAFTKSELSQLLYKDQLVRPDY